jgi:hypothetical protein
MRYDATDVISSASERERENLFKVQTIHVHSSSNPLYKQNTQQVAKLSRVICKRMMIKRHTHDVNERK